MPFTQSQADAMSVDEVEARFCRGTNGANLGRSGWDSPKDDDASTWSTWLAGLLWPSEYPPGFPLHVCSVYEACVEGAKRVNIDPEDDETAEHLARRVLATVVYPEVE